MEKAKKADKSKRTNEKPVSLHPIPFDEVVRGLLTIKPPEKAPKKPRSKS